MKKKDKKRGTILGKVKRAAASVKQVDMFGQSVNFSVDGEEKATSWLGTMVSLVIAAVTLGFAFKKFRALRSKSDT